MRRRAEYTQITLDFSFGANGIKETCDRVLGSVFSSQSDTKGEGHTLSVCGAGLVNNLMGCRTASLAAATLRLARWVARRTASICGYPVQRSTLYWSEMETLEQ
jgi:hypothetical protein